MLRLRVQPASRTYHSPLFSRTALQHRFLHRPSHRKLCTKITTTLDHAHDVSLFVSREPQIDLSVPFLGPQYFLTQDEHASLVVSISMVPVYNVVYVKPVRVVVRELCMCVSVLCARLQGLICSERGRYPSKQKEA